MIKQHLKAEVAGKLLGGMSPRWVREQVIKGNLEGYKMGRNVIVTEESVNALLERRKLASR